MIYDSLKVYNLEELRSMDPSELMTMLREAKMVASMSSTHCGKDTRKIQADIRLIREMLKG